ncbi:MAG: phosphoribosylanthranilate isomerase, partial [Planctomycetota bacterium]|nr:phosphoribosylanthranilate isomerase [Planctomycetota bacterium]
GLFVNAPPTTIVETARALGLRTVQLHGREAPAGATAIAPLRVLKALHFDAAGIDRLADWTPEEVPNLAAILWDAPPPPTGLAAAASASNQSQTGGHGRTIDWDELAMLLASKPADPAARHILAGGLTPQNVAQAIAIVRPYAVDVSSGVESSRGVKDVGLIEAFCRAVRSAQ